MFPSRPKRFVALIAALPLAVALAACGASNSSDSSSGTPGKPVNLDFWGWAPGYQQAVQLFNSTHKDVHVHFTTTQAGAKGGYEQMLNAVKAGNAPCLAQVGYESLPSFLAQDALQNVSQYADADKSKFVDWTWNQVSMGSSVYGAPVDTAPLALFYNKSVFNKYHLQVPTTWSQFASEAQQLHSADSSEYLTYYDHDPYLFTGLAWQNGARWFDTSGDSWKVAIDGQQTNQVAQYWQGLLGKKLLKTEPSFATAWYNDVNSGKIASFAAPVWATALVEQNAPKGKGQWQVAQLPQWQAGQDVGGNDGGSSTAVMKGCKNPQQAWEFASWMSTNVNSLNILIKQTGIYPAAGAGLNLPAVNTTDPYFGNQNVYSVFKDAAAHTATNWRWGPTVTQLNTDFQDSWDKVIGGSGTLPGALATLQSKTVADMKQQGMSVS